MRPKRFGAFITMAALSTATLLIAQSTQQPTPGRPIPGQVTPPNQGYVVPPQPPSPGAATVADVPADPGELGYWELYDSGKSISVTGKVTRVDWSEPNSYIYMSSTTGQWAIEASYIQFRKASIKPPIRANETITVLGYLPKDVPPGQLPAKTWGGGFNNYLKNHHLIRAGEITTTFGQKLTMGRPPTDAEIADRLKCSPFGC